jgi:hypothetical protein
MNADSRACRSFTLAEYSKSTSVVPKEFAHRERPFARDTRRGEREYRDSATTSWNQALVDGQPIVYGRFALRFAPHEEDEEHEGHEVNP